MGGVHSIDNLPLVGNHDQFTIVRVEVHLPVILSVYLHILPLTLADIIGRDTRQARMLVEIRTDKRRE